VGHRHWNKKQRKNSKIKCVKIYCDNVIIYPKKNHNEVECVCCNKYKDKEIGDNFQKNKRSSNHHLRPKSRFGNDKPWNLYPWFIDAHSAYHALFGDATLKEIWNEKLENIYNEICYYSNDEIKREERFNELIMKRKRFFLTAFGELNLESAKKILKKMMWWNVFLNLKPQDITEKILKQILIEINNNPDRRWAFEKLFGCNVKQLPGNILEIINSFDL